ncbi:arginine--tRNA ligase [Pseudomaricurvus alcaniphilus]|uniref:arginine--tRNA ligase n=1 Tax=Pseudomaricurvus alcaniphilus TaxID=1166482 RepID=UPI0014088F1A|nr:arginine--tRNA ligase [Pseudomaricurvus alcaniphilus]NHN39606.1 arginine--tRNA ligase [Pseudomaricurvus alcaniphilus]
MNVRDFLIHKVQHAMQAAGIPAEYGPHLAPSRKAGFGDYQANGAMAAAKAMRTNPRELAQAIVAQLQLDGVADKIEIAGPGFINIHLANNWLSEMTSQLLADPNLGQEKAAQPQTVVVDYSSPNLAKEMHVGHLRSTIIGDALVRALEYQGHNVIRQNHVGDWGTQFGMLIAELEEEIDDGEVAEFALKDLEAFYQQSKQHFDEDEEFARRARDYVVKLQSGDERILYLWEQFKKVSLKHSTEIYQQLNVTLSDEDVRGESYYNEDLPRVVADLQKLGLAQEDQGAQVVFLEELADKEGKPSPVIIQKQGGGYLYATSDLAALRYRANILKADRIMYFIDARQSLHMNQVFTLARKAKFVPESISLEHHAFGTMMGSDGKPFKTRSGGTVKLADLLNEAVERAAALIALKDPDLSEEEKVEVAEKVGIGAVKYADLSKTRTNDYIFNWDSMLSFEGNTAPYLQYAYTRIQSIFRKAGEQGVETAVQIETDEEKALALKLLQFTEVVEQVTREAYPHVLCTYLYEVASLFMRFYEACPILKSDIDPATRGSRLAIARVTARTLHKGLDLLGIDTMEKM